MQCFSINYNLIGSYKRAMKLSNLEKKLINLRTLICNLITNDDTIYKRNQQV